MHTIKQLLRSTEMKETKTRLHSTFCINITVCCRVDFINPIFLVLVHVTVTLLHHRVFVIKYVSFLTTVLTWEHLANTHK